MKQVRNSPLTGHLFAIFCVTAWGTSFLISKSLMTKLMPAQLMWLRFVIAYLAMWVVCPRWHFLGKEEWRVLLLSLIGNTLYFFSENTALQLTQPTNVSILVSSAPILSILLLRFFRQHDRLSGRKLIGIFLAFFGVLLVVFNGVFVLKLNPIGDALALMAALFWALYGFLAKPILERYDSALVTRKLMFYGILTSAPLLLAEEEPFTVLRLLTLRDLFGLLYLGLICSALCYLLWNRALDRLGALTTNLYVYAVPLVTMLASALFLRETITGIGMLGIVLVVGGMMLSSLEKPADSVG